MNIFNRKPRVERNAVDDVLHLSTEKNLEHHAEVAAEKVDKLLTTAVADEEKKVEELGQAAKRLELAQTVRAAREALADSVMSVFRKLRK